MEDKLKQAACIHADGWLVPTLGAIRGAFKAGAKWQNEQDMELLQKALTLLADLNGSYFKDDGTPGTEVWRRSKQIQELLYKRINS